MRSFGSRHIDVRISWEFPVVVATEVKSRKGRREDDEARGDTPIGNTRHSLTEESALSALVICSPGVHKRAIDTASYDEVRSLSHRRIVCLHFLDLRPKHKGFHLQITKAVGDLQRVGNDNVIQLGAARKRSVFNGCQPIGQIDARQKRVSCHAPLTDGKQCGRQSDRGEIRVQKGVIVYYLGSLHNRIGATDIHASREKN